MNILPTKREVNRSILLFLALMAVILAMMFAFGKAYKKKESTFHEKVNWK